MKSKYRFRRILSGVMAAVTILSTVISPLTVYASEEPKAAEPPAYESVKDQLDENEVVKATDLELEVGQDFDVSTDFTNLEIKDESKVKVTFQKAENDAGENFSTSHADTYHAVYYVEPVNQNHPVYQIGRNLIVKEPVTAAQSEPQTEQAVTEEDTGSDDEEAASQEETETVPVETEIVEPETAESETEEPEETEPEFQGGLSESEFDAALEEAETENTTDKESGLTLSDVLEQAGEQDIDLMAMEDGETVSFTAVNTSTRATQDVDVTRGTAYYYADYGLGSYVTYKYTIKFGNVSATAYCVQPSKAGPGDGVYKITKLGDSKALAKVCYYGTKASGENGFFSEKHPDFSAGKQFIIVHLAASYANNSSDAFSGTNATGQALAMELYNYCMSQPEIPEVDMSFSNADVTAYISGNSQRTEEITFKASELQTITMKLPSGVKLHNVTTGKTSSAGASVEICGGTKFYLSAPLTQAVDVKGEWSVTMKGSIIKDYSAYKITTGSETQDLALVFGEGVTDEKYVDFKVSWVKQATLEIVKKDRKSNKAIAGAVYGVYSDKDGKNLITKMPATDANGASSVTITKTQDTVYLKEISVPNGYLLDTKAYDVKLVIGDTVKQTVTDAEQMASLTVYKLGEVLTGAKVTDDGVSFVYTEQKQNRYLEYAKDTLVATVTTDETGSAVVENLPLGKYRVEEKKTPEGYTWNAKGEEVTFTYAGQDTPVVDEEVTFTNERQKVSITVEKQDAETGSTVAGATFGLYNKNEIKSGDKIIVKADTLLQEITSDEKGQAHFTLDLPLGTYYVKEISAPDGFVSSDEILEFDATYQGQDIPTIKLKSVKKNQPTTIEVTKSDLTTGVELNGASLSVLDKDGNVIDSWTSVKDEPHVIKYLTVGKTYTLRESLAPLGYLKTTDVEFTVQDTAKVQKVEMKDDVPKALLIVNKKGEFLDKITLLDNVKGVVEHLFEYITGSLSDVTFEIYAAEDIKAADGVSPDYYAKDELVATVTTDANGVAEVSDLPVGKYYVKEVGTAYGYVLDEEPRYVDLSYRDQDTPVVVYDEDWQNNRQKVKVNVLKKEKDTDRVLKGGIFGLYTRNDILSASGKVLMEADTLIELKTTDADGKISFIADLPIDGTYYVKELYAPDGFVTTGEEQEFVFEYQGDKEVEASYEFVFEDEPTTVELSKTDLTTGEELPGARLQLTDENGAVVEEWTSTKEPHIIKELVVGKSYTLTENKPADGYATAESITFTVENTAEIQKQVMEDDVTKVKISKTDITGDNEIEGAKLTITDENGNIVETWTSGKEPHYIEKLPIGKYTLKEEQAPNGYVVAEEITFEVADTAEIQKVAMKDDTAKGRLIIEKTDKDTGAALKDAEFELRDADGKVVETLTTDENGHATSGLLAIGTYKDGKFDKAATYYLVETKAPEGYQLDETKHEVTFTYVDDKTPVIEVIQKVTNEKLPEDTPFVSNPKTGDDTNLWIPALCLILSAGGLIGMGVASRRKKKKGGR
ncbi:SpaA isopeptide-forming pilin-related protein [Ruminococcus sp. 1001136sp1_2201st1_G3_2201SCRN_220225]|uniref:SpaA isopeptide-forming pilin-related protein n=1 Tax=Ruminococcus sp. 1001136sp1_2201st1_G3_2201SCRN_220225 TaxID=3141596 RepID=UPI0034A3E7A8